MSKIRAKFMHHRKTLAYLLLALTTAYGFYVSSEARKDIQASQAQDILAAQRQAYEARESQQYACENSGNDLREDIRREFISLKRALIAYYNQILPDAPNAPISVGIMDLLDTLHYRIHTIEDRLPDADCLKLYPDLDNPDTDQDES